jgi:hypothetical protein
LCVFVCAIVVMARSGIKARNMERISKWSKTSKDFSLKAMLHMGSAIY